jgi:hypothetical protein
MVRFRAPRVCNLRLGLECQLSMSRSLASGVFCFFLHSVFVFAVVCCG